MSDTHGSDSAAAPARGSDGSAGRAHGSDAAAAAPDGPRVAAEEPGTLDGITRFVGMRWDDPETVRVTIRPELINRGGLLSGVVTFALVDYCMGSALWVHTRSGERIATVNISINYIQTALEGEIVCRTTLDRRNRSNAVLKSEVRHEDGRLLATAIGSYAIFTRAPQSSGAGASAAARA